MDDIKRTPGGRGALLLAGVGCLAHLALVLLVPLPPLMDLPTHMARHWLAAQALSGAELPPFYHIEYRILPNLGGDLFMPLALLWLDVDSAMRLYLSVAVLLYWLGPTVFLARQGQTGWLLLPFWTVWLFTGTFFWGFLNFTMGLGLAFLTLAHHEVLTGDRQGGKPAAALAHVLLHAFLVTVLFFCHLVPWAIYGVLLGTKLIWQTWGQGHAQRLKPWFQAGLVCLPSLVCFVLYRRFVAGLPGGAEVEWSPLSQKLLRLLFLFRGYSWTMDALTLGLWLAALGSLVAPGLSRGRWHWTHLGIAVLLLLYFAAPDRIGGGGELGLRLLPALLVCLLASLHSVPPRNVALALVLGALALGTRLGSVGWAWHNLSERLESEAESFAFLWEGDRVLPVILTREFSKEHPEDAFLAWEVINKRVFIPNLLAYPDQQPLRYDERYIPCRRSALEERDGKVVLKEEVVRKCYNVLWVYNPEGREVVLPGGYVRSWEGGDLSVWRSED